MIKPLSKRKIIGIIALVILVLIIFFAYIGRARILHIISDLSSYNSGNITAQPPTQTSSSTDATSSTSSTTSNSTGTANTPPPAVSTVLPAESASSIGHVIGIAAGGGLSKISTSTLNQELNQMVSLGVKWVRFDIEWGDVQYSSSSSFTWESYDTLINALAAHHLRGLGVITFTPQWARDPSCSNGVECPPADPSTFATFAAAVAARYKSDGMHYWEIWNEPNSNNFWAPQSNCTAYTNLLKAVYPAIKQADPNAVVVTGGMSPASTDGNNYSPPDFLSCIYNNGGKNYFDAVGDHPYTYPSFPSNDGGGAWNQMFQTTPSLRSIMTSNGDSGKKIWLTEYGTPTNGPDAQWYVSEAQESQMVTDAIQQYKTYSWAGPLFWYTLEDSGSDTSTNQNFFGLIRSDGSTKPAYGTLQHLIAQGI